MKPEYGVFYKDVNTSKLKRHNVLTDDILEDIKKSDFMTKSFIKTKLEVLLKSRYWSRCEGEVLVNCGPCPREEDYEKIDVWYQIKPNLDMIVDIIIDKLGLEV